MKKRTKISLVAMSLCLVIALGVLGIFAVKTLNMSVGGNITFVADGILASISKGTMAGGSFVTPADADTKMKAVEVTTNKTETELNAELASWQGLNLAFAQNGADVTITFTIKNNSTQANSYIDVKTTINNGTAVNAYADVSPSWVVIDPGATQTFVITLSVITTEINASLTDFVVGFALSKTNTKTQTTNLSFDVGTAGNAANFPTMSYEVGSVIEQLPAPNVTNKTFEGWYTDSALTQKIEFPFTIAADTKLYAKYIEGTLMPASYQYDAASDSYFIVKNRTEGYTLPEIIVIPDTYNGPYGEKPITKFYDPAGNVSILGFNDVVKEVYIGNNVTYLTGGLFHSSSALEKVVIPDSVVEVASSGFVFSNCLKLKDITYSRNLTTVPIAFFQGSGISNIDFLPDTVTVIGKQAFAMCNNLTEVTIPTNVVEISAFAFAKSTSLSVVNMHSNVELTGNDPFWDTPYAANIANKIVSYYDIPNSKVLVKADTAITDTTQIPGYDTITHLAGSVFLMMQSSGAATTNTTLTNVSFPNVVEVGASSFYNCTALATVNLPKVEKIGYAAFYACKNLTTISLPEAESIGGFAFNDCSSLSTVEMSNVKYIANAAFQNCKNITINLHEGLLWIGNFAFNHCEYSTQTQIVIPSTLVQLGGREYVGDNEDNNIVGSHLFYNCATESLTEFVVAQGNQHFKTHQGVLYTKTYKYMISYPAANTRTSYEMPEGCEEVFELCFSRPHYLKTLTIPNSFNIRRASGEYAYNHPEMNNINNALYHYSAVDNIIIKSDNPNFKSIDGIVYSKDGTELIAVPTAYAKGEVLRFADSCTKINNIPFFYAAAEPTYNGIKVGKYPAGIEIGANVKEISQAALDAINSYTWTITSNSPYYTVNSEGKLVKA